MCIKIQNQIVLPETFYLDQESCMFYTVHVEDKSIHIKELYTHIHREGEKSIRK